MDPDEVLLKILEAARTIIATEDLDDEHVTDLADDVLNLHDWLSKGGFLPRAWDVPRTSTSPGTSGL